MPAHTTDRRNEHLAYRDGTPVPFVRDGWVGVRTTKMMTGSNWPKWRPPPRGKTPYEPKPHQPGAILHVRMDDGTTATVQVWCEADASAGYCGHKAKRLWCVVPYLTGNRFALVGLSPSGEARLVRLDAR